MKKRTKIILIMIAVLMSMLLIGGIVYALSMQTNYPDAVTEADGVYMEWVEKPTRENLAFRVCNESDGTIYGGSDYVVEYQFLGTWYQAVDLDRFWTYDLVQWVIEEHTNHTVMQVNPSLRYEILPPGKYRMIKRLRTVDDFTLYENRNEYIDLCLEFELH
jgi:hypothetical protein